MPSVSRSYEASGAQIDSKLATHAALHTAHGLTDAIVAALGAAASPGVSNPFVVLNTSNSGTVQVSSVGLGSAPSDTIRQLINTLDETRSGLVIRHGGNSGDGFSHPAGAQSAMYVTGAHTNPPANAGGLDLANFYLRYTGNMSAMTGTLENVEVVTDLNGITVAPTQTVMGLEVNIATAGANTGITFPDVRAIYGDVGIGVANGGTFTWARSISAALPSGATATGNAITNAAALYAFGHGGAAGSTIVPTNAYGLYVEVPFVGTNKWAAFIGGKTEINGDFLVTGNYSYLGDYLRIGGQDKANTIYQPTGNLALAAPTGKVIIKNQVNMPNLPTSASGLASGDLWNNGGTVSIVT